MFGTIFPVNDAWRERLCKIIAAASDRVKPVAMQQGGIS